jgi:predicted glutamine amidotransferase
MCLIALRDNVGAHIPNDVIEYNRTHNPDGFGIAWRNNGKLLYKKFGPKEWDAFHTLLKKVDKMPVVYAAHWRFATHGKPCAELSHPYEYKDKDGRWNLLFHNGVIRIDTPKEESDTLSFVKKIASNLAHDWWKDSAIRWAIEEAIGWSRILIMTNKNDVILNREAWVNEGGVLYSTTPIVRSVTKQWTKTDDSHFMIASGVIMPEEDEDEAKIADDVITHAGHPIEITAEGLEDYEDGEQGEEYGATRCLECGSKGSYIYIDGKMYVDMVHRIELLN